MSTLCQSSFCFYKPLHTRALAHNAEIAMFIILLQLFREFYLLAFSKRAFFFFLPASELCYTADNTQFSLKMLYYSNVTFQSYVMIIMLTVTLFFFSV